MKKSILIFALILFGATTFANNTNHLEKAQEDFYGTIKIEKANQNSDSAIVFHFDSKDQMDNFDFTKITEKVYFKGDCDISVTVEINLGPVSGSLTVTKHNVDCDNLAQETAKLYQQVKTSVKKIMS